MTEEERFSVNLALRRYNAVIHAAVLRDNWKDVRGGKYYRVFKPGTVLHKLTAIKDNINITEILKRDKL
jgi:hypothetical protein